MAASKLVWYRTVVVLGLVAGLAVWLAPGTPAQPGAPPVKVKRIVRKSGAATPTE